MSVRPAKSQITLGIRPVWHESSLCTQWVAKDPRYLHADSENSDWEDDQADLRLGWVHIHFVGFVMSRLVFWCQLKILSLGITVLHHYATLQAIRCKTLYTLVTEFSVCTSQPLKVLKVWLKWAASWQNQQNGMCAEQRLRSAWASAQSGIRPVWSESSLCAQWVAKDPSFLQADSKDSDQTGRMPRLIRVFAGPTCQFVGFVMRWLKSTLFVFL